MRYADVDLHSIPADVWPIGEQYVNAYSTLCQAFGRIVPTLKQLELSDAQVNRLLPTLDEISDCLEVFSDGFETFRACLEALGITT